VSVFKHAVALHKALLPLVLYATGFLTPGGAASALLGAAKWHVPMAVLCLVAFGGWLQARVYQGIGADGVYYGFKLGRQV